MLNSMTFPLPPTELERLAAISALGLWEGDAPPAWARLCAAAKHRFGVPYAAVTLIGRTEQRLAARCGIGVERTDRSLAFCNWTILHDEVFVVEDARRHREFAANPFVTGEPGVRFYAGAPLVLADGVRLGALCVIDVRPRAFGPNDAAVLRHLARMIVDEVWLAGLEEGLDIAAAGSDAPPPDGMCLTVDQIRGARGMLGWSVEALAAAAGVSPATVKRVERPARRDAVGPEFVARIRTALEKGGIEFLFLPGGPPAIRPRSASRS